MNVPEPPELVFSRSRRGYDPSEVDDYLARFTEYAARLDERAVAAETSLEHCGRALAEARGQLAAAAGSELSSRLAQILTLANEEADDIRERARVEAQSTTAQAARDAEEVRQETEERRLEAEGKIRSLALTRDGFLSDLRNLGAQIMHATGQYENGIVSLGATQEHLPVFDAEAELEPSVDATESETHAGDENTVTSQ